MVQEGCLFRGGVFSNWERGHLARTKLDRAWIILTPLLIPEGWCKRGASSEAGVSNWERGYLARTKLDRAWIILTVDGSLNWYTNGSLIWYSFLDKKIEKSMKI